MKRYIIPVSMQTSGTIAIEADNEQAAVNYFFDHYNEMLAKHISTLNAESFGIDPFTQIKAE